MKQPEFRMSIRLKLISGSATSDSIQVLSGVPQGTVLGPLLFLVFFNDLPDCVQSRIRLFADDCILYRCIKDKIDCAILQNNLNNLAAWEKKWAWHFIQRNAVRSESPEQGNQFPQHILWKATILTWKTTVEFESSMSWNHLMDKTIKKANSTLGFLRRNLRISNEQTKTAAYMYFSMVRSILEYCSTVLNPHTKEYINKMEMVQRRSVRYVANRYYNTSSVTSMLDHLEWESLESPRAKNQLPMLFNIFHGIVDIPAFDYLVPASPRTRSQHSLKFHQISASSDYVPTDGEGDILFLVRILLASALAMASASASAWHFLVCTISHDPVGGL